MREAANSQAAKAKLAKLKNDELKNKLAAIRKSNSLLQGQVADAARKHAQRTTESDKAKQLHETLRRLGFRASTEVEDFQDGWTSLHTLCEASSRESVYDIMDVLIQKVFDACQVKSKRDINAFDEALLKKNG